MYTSQFADYYNNVLRFQGSNWIYDCSSKAEPKEPKVHLCNKMVLQNPLNLDIFGRTSTTVSIHEIQESVKSIDQPRFACLITIASTSYTIATYSRKDKDFYIFDSYGGLFCYNNRDKFYRDLTSTLTSMYIYYRINGASKLSLTTFLSTNAVKK